MDLADDAWLAVLVVIDRSVEDEEDAHTAALLRHAAEAIRQAVGA